MTSPTRLARMAGVLYLLMAAASGFAELYVRSRLVESGDAVTTARNIRESATLFRAGFVVDLVAVTAFLLTAMVLYLLLRHVDQLAAAAMVAFVAVSVAIQSLNLLNQYTALTIATSDDYLRVFGQEGADQLVSLFADLQHNGLLIAQMFFGLWLLPLGYLVIKSGYLPKVVGALLIAACFSYLTEMFVHFLNPGLGEDITPFTGTFEGVAELVFMAWLLIKGVNVPAPGKQSVPVVATSSR
jgi:hypothetical protein